MKVRALSSSLLLVLVALAGILVLGHATSAYAQVDTQQFRADGMCNFGANPNADPNGSEPSDQQIKDWNAACQKGFFAAIADKATAPINRAPYGPCYTDSNLFKGKALDLQQHCHTGYVNAYKIRDQLRKLPKDLTPEQKDQQKLDQEATNACDPKIPGASNHDQLLSACADGYIGSVKGKKVEDVCKSTMSDVYIQFCKTGFELHQATIAPDSEAAGNPNACSSASLGLGWLVCGPIEMVNTLVDKTFKTLVKNTLKIDPLNGTGEDAGIYKVWNNFRTLANALLVVVFLVIVFANMITV